MSQEFIKKRYPNGDFDYDPPSWKKKIDSIDSKHKKTNILSEHIKDYRIKEDEIALKHPLKDSIVKLDDDGCINLFAKDELGIRIDPNTNSIMLFADNIIHAGKNVQFRTKPNGLIWNNHSFNSDLYYEDQEEANKTLSGTKQQYIYSDKDGWHWETKEWNVKPMVKPTMRTRYSDGMIEMLKNLGLPTDGMEG